MNIIAFIPARSGSKSIPHKNIKLLGKKPLIAWSIETAFASGFSRVIVSSDSEEYGKVAKEYGAEFLLRAKELAQDETSMFQVLKSEVLKIEPVPEIVVLLSPTSPFRSVMQVKSALSFFTANLLRFDSLMTVQKVPNKYNPAQVITSTELGKRMANGTPLSNRVTRRQEYPDAYVTAGGIYIFKTSNLEEGSFYGKDTLLMEIDADTDINSQEEWEECEKLLKSKHVQK